MLTLFDAALAQEPALTTAPPAFRRLDATQYQRSIQNIFGADIQVPGRFQPQLRDEGLLAIGDAKVSLTGSGFEQDDLRARDIASQVMAGGHRQRVLTCQSVDAGTYDADCAGHFFRKYGRLLYRRPLDPTELSSVLEIARTATGASDSFYKGVEFGLARLLVSPFFLFRVETADPETGGSTSHLDSYSLASRLSFLLWNAPPDEELLDAAADGSLDNANGLTEQTDRMMASANFEEGVRAFFSDMFAYDRFDGLTKEQTIYPKFGSQLAKDSREENLRTIVDLLVTRNGDYRDLFTTRQTFINRSLGAVYRVPVEEAAFDGWMPYTFASDAQRQGILTLAGSLMLDPTHEGRSSPTIRGKTVREQFLCQSIPQPPANVDFSVVQDTHNPLYKTARERLTAHRTSPACSGCHAIMDPLGLAMENYDAIGQFRAQENGAPIDASGKFGGKPYSNVIELEQLLHDDPTVPNCLVRRVFEYGVGRSTDTADRAWLDFADQRFADDGYRLRALMRTIATSRAFQTVTVEPSSSTQVAANTAAASISR